MSPISPCIWFNDNADEAARFYTSLFAEGEILSIGHYGEGMPMPAGTVLMVEFSIAGQSFQALNGGPIFAPNPSISFFVHIDGADEASKLFATLSEKGKVLMPLSAYPWSPCYGWVQDRFGVSWQIIVDRRPASGATIVPCMMFAGSQHGNAAAAMELYAKVFPDSHIESAEHYAAGEGPEDTIKHGRFSLAGQTMVVMDAHGPHEIAFSEGLSLSVRCADQAQVDHYWKALTEEGTPGRCGWLKDRFGVSWQIVPEALVQLQKANDATANGRMFAAMMGMHRLDIAALEAAWRGDGR